MNEVVRALCEGCGNEWHVATLPIEVNLFHKLVTGAHCPKCHNPIKDQDVRTLLFGAES